MDGSSQVTIDDAVLWKQRFVKDLGVIRSAKLLTTVDRNTKMRII